MAATRKSIFDDPFYQPADKFFPANHRIGLTLYNLDRIILGDLAPLTTALIDHDRREQLGEV